MSISINNIEETTYHSLMRIIHIFNITNFDFKFHESIFEIKLDDILIGVINYNFLPSMRKNKIYIRNVYYNDSQYLDIIIKAVCEYFKDHLIITDIETNPITEECVAVLRNNNFKGDKYIFYE
jgi:hypothetical protein